MHFSRPAWAGLLLAGSLGITAVFAADDERPSNRPAFSLPKAKEEPLPDLGPPRAGFEKPLYDRGRLMSEHFALEFDPKQLTQEQAYRARDQAEQAYRRCAAFFAQTPDWTPPPKFFGNPKIRINLTPDFLGVVGINFGGNDIRIRYLDLDLFGVSADYVFTHELAHSFTRLLGDPTVPAPLMEGMADYASGELAPIPIRLWMGNVFQQEHFWFDPDGYFITGEYDAPVDDGEGVGFLSVYAIEDTFMQFVVKEFGWKKFVDFQVLYREARRSRLSNAQLKGPRAANLKPKVDEIRQIFQLKLGVSWEECRDRWLAAMKEAKPPLENDAEILREWLRLARTRAGFETWEMKTGIRSSPEVDEVCANLLQAQRSLNAGYPKDAEAARGWAYLKFKLLEKQSAEKKP